MSYTERLANEIIMNRRKAEELQIENEELRFKVAAYKAQAFLKYDLANKLFEQMDSNFRAIFNGEFNGFCYDYDPTAEYLDFDDMYEKGILNEEEYNFCIHI